jgi:hypothetical protein
MHIAIPASVGIRSQILELERAEAAHALHRSVTAIGLPLPYQFNIKPTCIPKFPDMPIIFPFKFCIYLSPNFFGHCHYVNTNVVIYTWIASVV